MKTQLQKTTRTVTILFVSDVIHIPNTSPASLKKAVNIMYKYRIITTTMSHL